MIHDVRHNDCMSQTALSLAISISQLPSPERMNEYHSLVTHVAEGGGYLSISPKRYAPTEWKGTLHVEGVVHQVFGPTVEDVIHELADRVGAI